MMIRSDGRLTKTPKKESGGSVKEHVLFPEVMDLLRCSRATLYREIKDGLFPKPFKLTRNKNAWLRKDVLKEIEQRRLAANGQ
ncbi:AlpA family phage regulatory protein [Escherichia coli]|nr:AlpA family phage regulatory protein [Escherichia coli]EEW2311587.1 AlpA family phage regulatory protein [Escherichia coli]MHS90030.1 AlpA family phage regulatory protein [Escherichia coli]MIC86253.1 AlpA family phage regulatory protein [Escherichia coli]